MVTRMKIFRIIIYYLFLFVIFSMKTEVDKDLPYQKMKLDQNVLRENHIEAVNIAHDYNSSRSNK